MLFRIIILSILVHSLYVKESYPQTYKSQQNQIFVYNIVLSGLIGGIGGVINKEKGEKFYIAYGKNFLKGCLGGGIKYMAKYETFYLKNNETSYLAKPNRLFYYLGYSFVYNASLNRGLWHSYHCQFFGANLEFVFKDGFKVNSRISLLSTFNLIDFIASGYNFNFYKSLEYGLFYFDLNSNSDDGFGAHNTIAIEKNAASSTIPHEFVHTYQRPEFFPISNFFNRSFVKIKSKKAYRVLSKYVFLDVDYMQLFYWLQPKPSHYKNFFEFEAQHFGTRTYINR